MEIKVNTDDLASVAQVAKELGKTRLTIYRWVERGKIISIKLGGIIYIPKTEIGRLRDEKVDISRTLPG